MRRMILVLLAMVMVWPAVVEGGVDYRSAASTDYTVTFWGGKAVRQFVVMSYSADVELILYLDSVALDTVTVLARMPFSPVILCDQLTVVRSTSTAVLCTWNEFLSRDAAIASITYADPDPTSPEPRTWTSTDVISNWDVTSTVDSTTNVIGVAAYGARSILLDVTWDANTDDFYFYPKFGISAADDGFYSYGGAYDTTLGRLAVDESAYPDDHLTYEIPLTNCIATGYLYVTAYSTVDMVNVNIRAYILK